MILGRLPFRAFESGNSLANHNRPPRPDTRAKGCSNAEAHSVSFTHTTHSSHISELEKCANAYFRDIQAVAKRDHELELRFIDWNFADRLIKQEESFAAYNM
ncbi:hypothetical protein PG984_010235 [Apiospora sp. TS-2023a]